MSHSEEPLRNVVWTQVFPWLIIARVFRIAVSARMLILGATGMLLMLDYWALLATVFTVPERDRPWLAPADGCPWLAVDHAVADHWIDQLARNTAMPNTLAVRSSDSGTLDTSFFGAWQQLSAPMVAMFALDTSVSDVAVMLLAAFGSLAIWAFFGGAMARIAAVQLTCDEHVGLIAALRFACQKWLSLFAAPLIPACGIVAAGVPLWVLGLLLRSGAGMFLASLVWPVALVFGASMALLALGLLFAWPLMWATIATEGSDSFDALSRAYAYLFQRPIHYLFYAVVAAFLAWLGWLVVGAVTSGVVGMAYWSAGWGSGQAVVSAVTPQIGNLEGIGRAGAVIIRFWATAAKSLGVGFVYGFFWSGIAAVYLLLRRDVDATEMDEIFLEADRSEAESPSTAVSEPQTPAVMPEEARSDSGTSAAESPKASADAPDTTSAPDAAPPASPEEPKGPAAT